ncbi:MAG: Glycosyl transferase family 2 [Candidatus Roizmanbacteria bacterium GW2011_GWA2_37_7]|uniref:Glycosyl transferase family 2 n=1 Tax=Candidatus Roizmanbacteria bacterium GW2011_GWA2_37_7 TaxID=1618481 RepID=A0A0G0H4J2_9BACT|nr:MAG: Glycosyl transferase family 2 [Candidatus Roizmanbacteria bacterium GW2011_GWA2_37_7]
MNISLIIPCYNEEVNIQKGVLDRIGNYTKNDSRFGEVMIVDDGSTDSSIQIIETKYLTLFQKFRLIKNKHLGKAFAVIRGIQEAKEPYIMFSDIDLATPIEEAEKLISEAKKDYDIVIGSRSGQRKGAPLTRKIMALGMIFIRHYIIGLNGVYDTQCGFKLFKTNAAKKIISKLKVFKDKQEKQGSSVSAGFDLEFLFLGSKLGYSIKEVPVTWRHVETKNVTFIKSSVESLKDILFIKWYDILKKYPQ